MSSEDSVGGNPVEQALRLQGRYVRRRDRARLVAGLAFGPVAFAGAMMLSRFGDSDWVEQLISFALLALAWVMLVVTGGWWAARQLTSRIPPWPRSRRAARAGASAALVVASLVAVLLARTAPLVAVLFCAAAASALILLRAQERKLDQRIERLGHECLVLVGYR